MSEVFFTSIAQTKNNTVEQRQQISKSITIIYLIGFPIAFGWPLIAESFVDIILGDKWLPYISTISALGLLVITFSVGNYISQIMTATGYVKQLFYYDVFTLIFALLTLYLLSNSISNINDMATIRVYIGFSIIIIGAIWLSYLHLISLLQFLKPAIFTLFSAIMMNKLVLLLPLTELALELNFIITIVVAIFIYTICILIGFKLNAFGKSESAFLRSLIKQGFRRLKKG
jgi:O-antigen/teichoic acid export membrane protein